MFEWLTAGSQLRRWLERVKPWSWTTSLHLHTRTLLAQVASIKWPRTAVVCSPAMLVAKSIIQNCFHQRRWMACCMETAWFFKCLYTHRVKQETSRLYAYRENWTCICCLSCIVNETVYFPADQSWITPAALRRVGWFHHVSPGVTFHHRACAYKNYDTMWLGNLEAWLLDHIIPPL